jgi:hypothetical protein
MIFVTTAGEIQAAHKAGMVLVGVYGRNSPVWHGTPEQFSVYRDLVYAN